MVMKGNSKALQPRSKLPRPDACVGSFSLSSFKSLRGPGVEFLTATQNAQNAWVRFRWPSSCSCPSWQWPSQLLPPLKNRKKRTLKAGPDVAVCTTIVVERKAALVDPASVVPEAMAPVLGVALARAWEVASTAAPSTREEAFRRVPRATGMARVGSTTMLVARRDVITATCRPTATASHSA